VNHILRRDEGGCSRRVEEFTAFGAVRFYWGKNDSGVKCEGRKRKLTVDESCDGCSYHSPRPQWHLLRWSSRGCRRSECFSSRWGRCGSLEEGCAPWMCLLSIRRGGGSLEGVLESHWQCSVREVLQWYNYASTCRFIEKSLKVHYPSLFHKRGSIHHPDPCHNQLLVVTPFTSFTLLINLTVLYNRLWYHCIALFFEKYWYLVSTVWRFIRRAVA
jgi:hypothetical protein